MSGNSEIIKRIDNLLKMRHLKREVAYEVAGIAHNSFSNWCRTEDAKIPAQALYLIAQFLNVSVEYLLTGKDSIPQSQAPKIPPEILDTAYEIYNLPDVYRKIVLDTVRTLKKDVIEKEKEKGLDSSYA